MDVQGRKFDGRLTFRTGGGDQERNGNKEQRFGQTQSRRNPCCAIQLVGMLRG